MQKKEEKFMTGPGKCHQPILWQHKFIALLERGSNESTPIKDTAVCVLFKYINNYQQFLFIIRSRLSQGDKKELIRSSVILQTIPSIRHSSHANIMRF